MSYHYLDRLRYRFQEFIERAANVAYGDLINQEHQLARPDFIPLIEIGDEAIDTNIC